MSERLQVMIGSERLAKTGNFDAILQSKGLDLTRFHSVKQACKALSREDIFLVFCENKFADGTAEDLLNAAKRAHSRARIVIAPSRANQIDAETYERAKHLGAFDVLREYYGPRDVEWIVTCALREEKSARAVASRNAH